MTEEIWKELNYKPYNDLYLVSNTGKVKRVGNEKPNKGHNHAGYNRIKLSKNDLRENVLVHRLVAFTFIDNDDPEHKKEVNHIDGNKLNNHVSNLEWISSSNNSKHAIRTGLRKIHTRPIIITDSTGYSVEFQTHEQAAAEAGINSRSIRDALKNGTKPFGWTIKYKFDKDIKIDIDLTGFKTIPKYPKYMINEQGQVYGKIAKRILQVKPRSTNGYIILSLKDDNRKGKRPTVFLHKILAETFIPNPNNLPEVNHIDHNKMNYSLNNLEWCTRIDNMKKCAEHMKQIKEGSKVYKPPILRSFLRNYTKVNSGSGENSEVKEKHGLNDSTESRDNPQRKSKDVPDL